MPFPDTEGFVAPTVERSPLGFPGGHEREGILDRLNPHYMEAEVTYTAARPVVTVPARRASAERPASRPGRKAATPTFMYLVELAPASRWGLACAESACVTDFKGPNLLVVLQRAKSRVRLTPTLAPLESPVLGGAFLCRPTACAAGLFILPGRSECFYCGVVAPNHRSPGTTGEQRGGGA